MMLSSSNVYAKSQGDNSVKEVTVKVQEGTITLGQLIAASKEIADSKSCKSVDKSIAGQVITIDGATYEVRYFSFEDTSGKLSHDMTFSEYAVKNNLMIMKSTVMEPLPGIHFESFDYRRAKLEDGVYFSMALRLLKNN